MKSAAYRKVSLLISNGVVEDFEQIAVDIQKKVLAADLHMHFRTLMARVKDPGKWQVGELRALSDLLELDHSVLLLMADRLSIEVEKKKESAKSKKRGKK